MMRHLTLTLIGLSLTACSGNSLIPSHQDTFHVDSVPVGASVLVLGEAMGQTPMSLSRKDVFPHNYDHSMQHLYGRVEIRNPGCKPFITTVSSRVLSDGLKAKLECGEKSTQPVVETEARQGGEAPLKQRLIKLKDLYEEGLISEQEYEAKRQQLLEEL